MHRKLNHLQTPEVTSLLIKCKSNGSAALLAGLDHYTGRYRWRTITPISWSPTQAQGGRSWVPQSPGLALQLGWGGGSRVGRWREAFEAPGPVPSPAGICSWGLSAPPKPIWDFISPRMQDFTAAPYSASANWATPIQPSVASDMEDCTPETTAKKDVSPLPWSNLDK